MDKNLRIRTNLSQDAVVNVNISQDIKTLDILSLQLHQENYYKLHESSYGVIVGRVLANDAFGIPNAKVSVFIELDDDDSENSEITNLYPYTSVQSFDKNNRRYNLLPDTSNNECYKIVGTFPNKRLVLDDDSVLEVYDKYWKYTTVTNNAGDYMIFGIPTGNQEIHVDIDLSDIGVLSQKPRDMLFKGYNIEQFDSPTQFKTSTNLNNLSQILSQNQSVYVYPFWGDESLGEIAISRCDINIDYKFETTCVFMGSLVTDNSSNQISHTCSPSKYCGFNRDLIAGEGIIEMIRKTPDGLTEEYQIKGNKLIDANGVWCYQIPMNLDYVQTDEYGNIVPTDNPNKGIATRTRVRFRISFGEEDVEGESKHRAKYLVPNNPQLDESYIEPYILSGASKYDNFYNFGSNTLDESYRNLYWNKVYSVKSYIPRVQIAHRKKTQLYSGIRTTNTSETNNPFPFNKARFKLFFVYRVVCLILTILVDLYYFINYTIINTINALIKPLTKIPFGIGKLFKHLTVDCLRFEAGLTDDTDTRDEYYPGCSDTSLDFTECKESGCNKISSRAKLVDTLQQNLAQEFDTVNLDFYNDWVNGCLYYPVWYWKKRKKKSYLFGLIKKKGVNTFCNCDNVYSRLKNSTLCALNKTFPSISDIKNGTWRTKYTNKDGTDDSGTDWDTRYFQYYPRTKFGLIKQTTNVDDLNIYYYSCGNINNENYKFEGDKTQPYVRLFSTDIILLGSFNDCDLDGVPKLFRYLPNSTANIPFMAKLTEDETPESESGDMEEGTKNDSGKIVITGMDWLYSGGTSNKNGIATFGEGLFMDLACTKIGTKPKTNVNLERLCELGVTLDMSYEVNYTNGDSENLSTNKTTPDGMITRYEINDDESRQMFASLNHLGLESLVRNKQTTYDVYKIGGIFPTDFDGMLTSAYPYTRNLTNNVTYDNLDTNYIEYRLGEHPHAYLDGEENKSGENITFAPLYNNSFYFYFGIKDGNTAIDVLKKQYDSICYDSSIYPFNINYKSTPGTWCAHSGRTKDIDKDYVTITIDVNDVRLPYSFKFYNSNEKMLFSGNNVSSEIIYIGFSDEGQTKHGQKAFIYDYNDGEPLDILDNKSFLINDTYTIVVTDSKGKTQTGTIEVKGQAMSIEITKTDLSAKYYGYNSTTINDICNKNELYGTIEFKNFYIDGHYYGVTNVTALYSQQPLKSQDIYGYNLTLTSATHHQSEHVFLYFTVNSLMFEDNSSKSELDITDIAITTAQTYNHKLMIEPFNDGSEQGNFNLFLDDFTDASGTSWWLTHPNQAKRHNCGCQGTETDDYLDVDNGISSYGISTLNFSNGVLTFRVWIPSIYNCYAIEYCDWDTLTLSNNIVAQSLNIENGKEFGATLDNMPVNFMISASSKSLGSFYEEVMPKYPMTPGNNQLKSWYNLFKINVSRELGTERTGKIWNNPTRTDSLYALPDYTQLDKLRIYEDYMTDAVDLDEYYHITDNGVLTLNKNILQWVFDLASATYITDSNEIHHSFKVIGGKAPSLIRNFHPRYDKLENPEWDGEDECLYSQEELAKSHFLTDKWYADSTDTTVANTNFPDIVCYPYKKKEEYPQHQNNTDWEDVSEKLVFNKHVDTNAFPYGEFYLSTYYAGFSNNGGFIQGDDGDWVFNENAKGIVRIPKDTNVFKNLSPKVMDEEIKFKDDKYKDTVTGDGQTYKSYMPAPFIDRRFDYDLYICNIGDGIKFMNGSSNNYNVGSYNSMTLNGITYVHGGTQNGIELTYNNDTYEILGREDDKDLEDLEYSYKIVDRNVSGKNYKDKLYYFNSTKNGETSLNPKHRFYKCTTNGYDMTDFYRAEFRKQSIQSGSPVNSYNDINPNQKLAWDIKYNPWGSKEMYDDTYYNGRYNSTNYITKRVLNYAIPKLSTFSFNFTGCSYSMSVTERQVTPTTEGGEGQTSNERELSCIAKEGEEVSFSIDVKKSISISTISLTDAINNSTYNILYVTGKGGNYNNVASIKAIRMVYRIKSDDVASGTFNTVSCPCNLILSKTGHIYEYLSYLTDSSGTYETKSFSGRNISDGYSFTTEPSGNAELITLPSRLSSNGFSKAILVSNSSNYISEIAYDNTDAAQEVRYIISNNKDSFSMIKKDNAFNYYNNGEAYYLGDKEMSYDYLGIGGIRRYINTSTDNLNKSIHLLNFSKIYAIHPFIVEYVTTVYTATTDNISVTASTGSSSASAEGRAETYTQTEFYLDFQPLISASNNTLLIKDIINGLGAKIDDTDSGQQYISSNATCDVFDSTKVHCSFKFYGLRPQENDEGGYNYYHWKQEVYLKMYNDLVYCITYPYPKDSSFESPFVDAKDINERNE